MAADIQAIVQLAIEEPICPLPREITCCRFPLLDGAGNALSVIDAALSTVVALLRNRTRALVCCGAGRSRSPAIAAAALAELHAEDPTAWLKRIAENHPVDVSPGFWQDMLRAVAQRLHGRTLR